MAHLRTMFGDTKQVYGWNYDLMKDFNFKVGLTLDLNDLFQARHDKDKKCGTAPEKAVMKNAHHFTDLDLSIFDVDVVQDH